jgi:hypothetical protein
MVFALVYQVDLEKYWLDWVVKENLVCNLVALVMIELNVFDHSMEQYLMVDDVN